MKKGYLIWFLLFFFGCNLTDESVKLPGGHTFVDEGKCHKFILVNIKDQIEIESTVSEYKFDNDFITASQIDENACRSDSIKLKEKSYFIIDNKKQLVYGPLSKTAFAEKLSELKADNKLLIE